MAQTSPIRDDLVAMLRRDLSQIQLLADLDALNPENLRQLLGSLGELVNVVETLADILRESVVPTPAAKLDRFRALQDQHGVQRMRSVNGLGVIDGGLSS